MFRPTAFVAPALPPRRPARVPRRAACKASPLLPSSAFSARGCARAPRFSACAQQPLVDAAGPSPSDAAEPTRCGFVALLGPSNSGKSTLLNRLVGNKVAIVTPKVQTTRCRVTGVAIFGNSQVAFLDTPGIFAPNDRLSRAMVKSAWTSGRDADVIAVILDAASIYKHLCRKKADSRTSHPELHSIFEGLAKAFVKRSPLPICVCANKMDAVPKKHHAEVLTAVESFLSYLEPLNLPVRILPISARHGDQVEQLVEWTTAQVPPGPWLYPEDEMTDMPARQLAAEVSREKAFLALQQELPYEIAVETTSYKELADGSIRITQDVIVSRDSQKRIVTGQGGSVVKAIGSKARKELGELLGTTVHLMLTVKVNSKWKQEKSQYKQWGLDYNA